MKVLHTVAELVATAVRAAPDVSGAVGHLEMQSVEEQSSWWFWGGELWSRGGLHITLLPAYLCGTQLNKIGWFWGVFCINSMEWKKGRSL